MYYLSFSSTNIFLINTKILAIVQIVHKRVPNHLLIQPCMGFQVSCFEFFPINNTSMDILTYPWGTFWN